LKKFLIIQTAFIGDVVLATSLVEKLHQYFPDAEIDFLLRKGNEGLLKAHPYLHEVLIWDKKESKLSNLWKMLKRIRSIRYDKVINIQRYGATGVLTVFSRAKEKIGFDKNPFSFLFDVKLPHEFGGGSQYKHEIERNQDLIKQFTDHNPARPALHPSAKDWQAVKGYKAKPYITISPASVWFTKQYPKEKWISFINKIPLHYHIYLLGAPSDSSLAEEIRTASSNPNVTNLSGKLSFLESAALMKDAEMNYVNDSAPLHFASAMNAPVCAVYCSTIPAFGYGPLSDKRFIVEIEENLSCRPCGLHGRTACPLGHFRCALDIRDEQLLEAIHPLFP
jgi:lipopolysaccharide heptosyltransferase II